MFFWNILNNPFIHIKRERQKTKKIVYNNPLKSRNILANREVTKHFKYLSAWGDSASPLSVYIRTCVCFWMFFPKKKQLYLYMKKAEPFPYLCFSAKMCSKIKTRIVILMGTVAARIYYLQTNIIQTIFKPHHSINTEEKI